MKKLLVAGGIIGLLTTSIIGCGKEEVSDTPQTVMTGEESPEQLFNAYHKPLVEQYFKLFDEYDALFGEAADNIMVLQDPNFYERVGAKTGELENVCAQLEEYGGPIPDEYQEGYDALQVGTEYLRQMVDKTAWAVAPLAEGKNVRYNQLVDISETSYSNMVNAREKLGY